MYTPAHAVLNLAALAAEPAAVGPVLLGAVLPDLPLASFYVLQRGLLRREPQTIWREVYWQRPWIDLFHASHSFPLIAIAAALCWLAGSGFGLWLTASMALHALFDLPLHHSDAHRHLYPFSEARFLSPVSYWDPAHRGALGALFELAVVVASTGVLWARGLPPLAGAALVALGLGYGAHYYLSHLRASRLA